MSSAAVVAAEEKLHEVSRDAAAKQIRKRVWAGAVPIQFSLASTDLTALRDPGPYFVSRSQTNEREERKESAIRKIRRGLCDARREAANETCDSLSAHAAQAHALIAAPRRAAPHAQALVPRGHYLTLLDDKLREFFGPSIAASAAASGEIWFATASGEHTLVCCKLQ